MTPRLRVVSKVPEEYNEVVGEVLLNNLDKQYMQNWHSVRTIVLLVVLFLVAGLQAIHGMTTIDSVIDGIIPVLLVVEHILQGNTKEL